MILKEQCRERLERVTIATCYANILAEPLSDIFNKLLETSIVPRDWQTVNVVPIF